MSNRGFELVLVLVARVGRRLFDGSPRLFDGVEFRRVAGEFDEAHAVRRAPRAQFLGAVPRRAVQKKQQARVACVQAFKEREHARRINALEERVVLLFTVDRADRVKLFASEIRFRYRGLAANEPASREVGREDETALVQAKRGSPLPFGAEDFAPRFFLNAATSLGELW